jgi:surface protein
MKKLLLSILFIFGIFFESYSQEFITKWSFETAATQILFNTITTGVTNYTWSASPSGNSGFGIISNGGSSEISGLNIEAGDVVTLAINPSQLKRFTIAGGSDRLKLTDVSQWGSAQWTTMENAFLGCENLNISAIDVPDLTNVSDMSAMFAGASAFNSNIGNWNTSSVTDMRSMFAGASTFNSNIGNWNTANVTTMTGLFEEAKAFNQNIGNWNTANVTTMERMFLGAEAFNQNIGNWNTSNVANMSSMFQRAKAFNQNIGNWNTGKVTNMSVMFLDAKAFNHDIGNWNTSVVKNLSGMFVGASLFNQDIGDWNTSNVEQMSNMFAFADNFNQDIGNWNTSKVTAMNTMFNQAALFNQNLGNWDISKVIQMSDMFSFCGIDCNNYSATLYGWNGSAGNTSSLVLGAIGAQYGSSIVPVRNDLIDVKGWTIDGDVQSSSSCSSLIQGCVYMPSNGSANVAINTDISWIPSDLATGYVLVAGTSIDGSNILDSLDVGNVLTYDLPSNFISGTKIFLKVIPYNSSGFLVGCAEISFTTENNNFITKWNFPVSTTQVSFNALTDSIVDYSWKALPSGKSGMGSYTSLGSGAVTLTGLDINAGDIVTISMVSNKLKRFYINNGPNKSNLIDVSRWGGVVWSSMNGAFFGCENLNISATDLPNLSNVNDMSYMFAHANVFNSNIGLWNTESVTNMSHLFDGALSFNQDISEWKTSNVTDMSYMFNQAIAFNQNIDNANGTDKWNTTNVLNMAHMFHNAASFNQPIGSWETFKVTDMSNMFDGAILFNAFIKGWNTVNVTNMSNMFHQANAFNQELENWNTFNVSNMIAMFKDANAFNQSLGLWNLSSINSMANMLDNCGMDCNQYSSTLNGWSNNNPTIMSKTLGAVGRQYGINGQQSRNVLISSRGWNINGDLPSGVYCGVILPKLLKLENKNTIKIAYTIDLDPATVNDFNIFISGDETGLRQGDFSVNKDTIIFESFTQFRAGETIHVTCKDGIKYASGINAPSYSWQIQSKVTNKTNAKFNTYNTGVTLPNGATNYKYSSTMCDMNLDEKEDIIFSYNNLDGAPTNTMIYLRNNSGGFDSPLVYTNTESNGTILGSPDLDNDGFADLILFHNDPSKVQIRFNNQSGELGVPTFYAIAPNCSGGKVADIDKDGDLDIITFSASSTLASSGIDVLLNLGDGTFVTQEINTSVYGNSLLANDIDNDGDFDILYTSNASFGGNPIFNIYTNNGTGGFTLSSSENNPSNKTIGGAFDFNHDGLSDIYSAQPSVDLYLGTVNVSMLNVPAINILGQNAQIMHCGDLDGDHDLDLFIPNSYTGSNYNSLLKVALNDGVGNFTIKTDPSLMMPSASYLDLGDYDHDGDLDHLYRSGNQLLIGLNDCSDIRVITNADSPLDGIYRATQEIKIVGNNISIPAGKNVEFNAPKVAVQGLINSVNSNVVVKKGGCDW